jgi:hypothetical protein
VSVPPELPVPLSALREAVRRAVAGSSERAVASAVGMSQRGLRLFVGGAKPHASTLRKLTLWYVSQSAGVHLDQETAEAVLALLTGGLPEKERAGVRERVLDVLREAHRAAGTNPPEWLK